MTGIQIKTGISETGVPAGRFVWKMRNGHALAMMTGLAFVRISLSHHHDLALPHRPAAAQLITARETAGTAQLITARETAGTARGRKPAGTMRKSSTRRGRHGSMHLTTTESMIEPCRTVEAPCGADGMSGRTKTSMRMCLLAVVGQKSSGRIVEVTRETGAHGMTNQLGSTTRRKVPGYQHGNEIKSLPRTGRTRTDLRGVIGRVATGKTGRDPSGVVLPMLAG
jgi:hypothetical protein